MNQALLLPAMSWVVDSGHCLFSCLETGLAVAVPSSSPKLLCYWA